MASFRSSSSDDAAYFAIKGGMNDASHGDLDNGQFVFDWNKTRWLHDWGIADYSLPNINTWEKEVKNNRFQYYKKRAEGHNIFTIDQDFTSGWFDQAVQVADRCRFSRPRQPHNNGDFASLHINIDILQA